MDVPGTSSEGKLQPVPRQITIEILGDDVLTSQPVKITSFPVNTSPLKVVDFRQITMKSDMTPGSEIKVSDISQLVTPAGVAKAKTQLAKVITKDMLAAAKEGVTIQKDDSTSPNRGVVLKTYSRENKTLAPRTILPKPSSQLDARGDDPDVPVRIKQVSRIGSSGISEKVNVLEVIPKATTSAYTPVYKVSSTPSSTTASNSPAVASTSSRRGRKRHSRRSYYAYVSMSEDSDTEMGINYDRQKKKRKKNDYDVIFDDKEVKRHRRSKSASLRENLMKWGLVPSGAIKSEFCKTSESFSESKSGALVEPGELEENLAARAGPSVYPVDNNAGRIDEEEDEEFEPVVPGPPPKFITIKPPSPGAAAEQPVELKVEIKRPPYEIRTVMDMEDIVSGDRPISIQQLPITSAAETALAPQIQLLPPPPATTPAPALSSVAVSVQTGVDEMELSQATDKKELIKVEKKSTATPLPAQKPQTPAGVGATGWIKKASSMLAPPLYPASQSHPVTPFPVKRRNDTMNKSLMCKPIMLTKATTYNLARPHKATQTEEEVIEPKRTVAVPLPIPYLLPVPGFPFVAPTPHPLPISVPVPVPCVVPATRKNIQDLMKSMQEMKSEKKMASAEAELLDMAEVIADTKTEEDMELESYNATIIRGVNDQNYVYPGTVPAAAPYGSKTGGSREDVLEMAMRMAADMPEDPNNTNGATGRAHMPSYIDSSRSEIGMMTPDGSAVGSGQRSHSGAAKSRFLGQSGGKSLLPDDSRMKLKYSYALKAWKYWAEQKNHESAKLSGAGRHRARYIFDSDPLKCSCEELNAALSMFVKELRKPTGEKYSPDTIYYLCLGIQYYLKENHRQDSIFFDVPYQKFTDTLNELLMTFELRLNPQNFLICRVTEDYLWESMQLGPFSPQILLNTLIYFNTKYFLFDTVEAHFNLSFSAIERSAEAASKDGVAVRKLALKKSVALRDEQCKQLENLSDPVRCPVKLYEFYLSKCPESMRNNTRCFYFTPEPTAKVESHYWYSTNTLSKGALTKMLNRVKVVKEIQITRLQHLQHAEP